jgi:hypothetical protein
VALGAGNRAVCAQQHKRDLVVVEIRRFPCIHVMATAALSSQISFMWIILAVTPFTSFRCFSILRSALVTGVAGRCLMRSAKRESSLRIVIEVVLFPVTASMAVLTRAAVAPLVRVVLAMATDALQAGIPEVPGIGMTGDAFRLLVFSGEREPGFSMIETNARLPATRLMAGFTRTAESICMLVVLAVAAYAGCRGAFEADGVGVAALAFGSSMFADQRETRRLMVKSKISPSTVEVALLAVVAE